VAETTMKTKQQDALSAEKRTVICEKISLLKRKSLLCSENDLVGICLQENTSISASFVKNVG
jgi:hypothetical protein